jgi:hypothetical protein
MTSVVQDQWWHRVVNSRPPDFVIGRKDETYLRRWWLVPRNAFANAYLHQFLRSDDEVLHDHMYVNLSVLLEGEYVEHTISQGGVHYSRRFRAGDWRLRLPTTAHRIEVAEPCWSLFLTGPRVREWGFHCPRGWRHWRDFTDERDQGQVGRGCED